jgi:hypothetical protein
MYQKFFMDAFVLPSFHPEIFQDSVLFKSMHDILSTDSPVPGKFPMKIDLNIHEKQTGGISQYKVLIAWT